MRFAPEYVTYILNENFEDAKELFLTPLMALHYAHLVMLAERVAAVSCRQLEADEEWWKGATDALGQAEHALAQRSAAL